MTSTADQLDIDWVLDIDDMDWDALSELYRVAPLGVKPPDSLRTVFSNSMFKCFIYSDGALIGAGRAIADGLDCAYLADVAVHPDFRRMVSGRQSSADSSRLRGDTRR